MATDYERESLADSRLYIGILYSAALTGVFLNEVGKLSESGILITLLLAIASVVLIGRHIYQMRKIKDK